MMIRKILITAPLIVALSGCGINIGTGSARGNFGFNTIRDNIQAARGRNTPQEEGAQTKLTRDVVNGINRQIVQISLSKYGTKTVFTRAAVRQGAVTYLSPQKQTVTVQGGRVIRTRGLPFDLLETDFRNDADRVYRYLNAANNITELRVSCSRETVGTEAIEIVERSYTTTLVEEVCRSSGVAFKNRFWTQGSTIWKSEQWIGPNHGFATIEKLN